MDIREQEKEIIMPAGAGAGGYGHIFGETSAIHNGSHHVEGDRVAAPAENVGATASFAAARSKARAASGARYRECLKNHAASVGGNIYDGCGEFMPSGDDGTLEALKCAACDCHRNFHRKEIPGESPATGYRRGLMLNHLQTLPALPSPPAIHKFSMAQIIPPMNVAYAGAGGTESSSEDLNVFQSHGDVIPASSFNKKRFRTKFTPEQKDRMLEFAEKVGWRIQKQDEEQVERFCGEIGVKRQVLKVWMHNNKNTMKKMNQTQEPELAGAGAGGTSDS